MEPKVYVASLSDYNAGVLHGAWIDAAQDIDDIRQAIQDMLADSPAAKREGLPAEEWAIHDYEDMPDGLGEFCDLDTLAEIGAAIEEHGDAFMVAYENFGDVNEALQAVTDNYAGEWRDLEEYADEYIDSTGMLSDLPDDLRYYFDTEAFARDMELGGDVWTAPASGGGIHVFYNR